MEKMILIKYGELTTKGNNRKVFIKKLAENIKKLLKNYPIDMTYNRVRMYIELDNEYLDEVSSKLTKIFGIHSIVICHKVDNDPESIKEKVLEILKNEKFETFKVETNRANKNFEIPSMEFNKVIGSHVLKNIPCKVDVHNPDLILHIEIRESKTYIYTNEIKASGGYPVGIQGKGLLMLSGGIDSPVAGYLALKRGVGVECLYFEAPPHTSMEAKNKVRKLASIINDYSGNVVLHVVNFTKLQEAIYEYCNPEYMITIMRRMMYRIATLYAKKIKCDIIINGESVGQVASQTTTSMKVINEVTNTPVLRPVGCMDKIEIMDLARKIGTYETSILPYEDCCTIFLPKHPVINPKLETCIKEESKFDYESLVNECVESIEVITNLDGEKYTDIL